MLASSKGTSCWQARENNPVSSHLSQVEEFLVSLAVLCASPHGSWCGYQFDNTFEKMIDWKELTSSSLFVWGGGTALLSVCFAISEGRTKMDGYCDSAGLSLLANMLWRCWKLPSIHTMTSGSSSEILTSSFAGPKHLLHRSAHRSVVVSWSPCWRTDLVITVMRLKRWVALANGWVKSCRADWGPRTSMGALLRSSRKFIQPSMKLEAAETDVCQTWW